MFYSLTPFYILNGNKKGVHVETHLKSERDIIFVSSIKDEAEN
jgi:hypothetical protein